MHALQYYILLPLLYLIALLPFPFLYLFSDFLYFIIYYIIRYRRKIVAININNSFPELPPVEKRTIAKKFYRNFSDIIAESVKMLLISRKQITERCYFAPGSLDIFQKLYGQQKNVIVVMGHCGNWEWAGLSFSILSQYTMLAIYHPLINPYFDRLMYRLRSKFGGKPVEMKNVFRDIISYKENLTATAFITDQSPAPESALWIEFLNQDTPVFQGTEKIARKLNYPVVFANVKRKKRGYYEIHFEMVSENPASTIEGEITKAHTLKLEQAIREQPDNWLWSHRRWKHKREIPNSKLQITSSK